MTRMSVGLLLNGLRQLLREALESGEAGRAGLQRAFIVALPTSGIRVGRRRPFPDDVARALAHPGNLDRLAASDPGDRGSRDIWEALVLTGRRCGEVLNARLDCISRHNKVPLFWRDQTKVGNLDAAIRIPERLYQTIELRQAITIAQFVQRQGREPTVEERSRIALFPRRTANHEGLKGVSYGWFHRLFRAWVLTLDIGRCVPHQTRHALPAGRCRTVRTRRSLPAWTTAGSSSSPQPTGRPVPDLVSYAPEVPASRERPGLPLRRP